MRTKLQSRRSIIKAVSEEWGPVRAMISVTWVLDSTSDCPPAPSSHCRSQERAGRHGAAAPPPPPPLHRPCRHVAWLRHASHIVQLLSSHGLFYNCECNQTHAHRAINTVSVTSNHRTGVACKWGAQFYQMVSMLPILLHCQALLLHNPSVSAFLEYLLSSFFSPRTILSDLSSLLHPLLPICHSSSL